MFDFFWKPKSLSKYPAYLGHTVHQSEYDAKCEEVITLGNEWDKTLRELTDLDCVVGLVRQYLEPFATTGAHSGGEADSTLQLAANARDILTAGSATMKQMAMENEQLQEQLQESTSVKLQTELDAANESVEVWKDKAQYWKAHLQEQLDTLNRNNEVLLEQNRVLRRDLDEYRTHIDDLMEGRTTLKAARAAYLAGKHEGKE